MRFSKLVIATTLAMTTALVGCKSTQEVLKIGAAAENNPGPCPRAFALYDASRIVEFRDNAERFANVGFTGEFEKVRSLCRYYGANPITRKNVGVINKQTFPIQVTFPAGEDRVRVTERIDKIVIPRAKEGTSGENFEIIVGFEVTESQRAFNTDGKRFRVSAGQN